MTESQYNQYININIFAREYRKYKPVESEILSIDDFRKEMQYNSYFKLQYINDVINKPVAIFLIAKESKYANSSQDLKKMLSKLKEPTDVILITYMEFKTYSNRAIATFKHLRIKTYLHENFDLIIPKGPLCYPHRIMSHSEVNNLLNNVMRCALVNLPKILLEDPQCIWIGAEVADVIEITMPSDTAGEMIQYRVVVPRGGRMISFRAEEPVEAEDDDDDTSAEHREAAKNEISDDEDTGDVDQEDVESDI